MNAIEAKSKAVEWLFNESARILSRPWPISPKQIAHEIGASYTVLGGRYADEIVNELNLRGVSIKYNNNSSPCIYTLLPQPKKV